MRIDRRTAKPAGFTLVELLIVIGVLAFLGVTLWQATAYYQAEGLKNQAKNEIAELEACMNAYKADNSGTLPYGKGDEWSSHVLYSSLYCDEDNDGAPDRDGAGVMRKPYCEALAIVADTSAKERERGIPVAKARVTTTLNNKRKSGKYFLIFDPWKKPYRYRLGYESEDDKGKVGNGMNPDFDIFSLGPDGLGDGKTNDGDNADNISNVKSWK